MQTRSGRTAPCLVWAKGCAMIGSEQGLSSQGNLCCPNPASCHQKPPSLPTAREGLASTGARFCPPPDTRASKGILSIPYHTWPRESGSLQGSHMWYTGGKRSWQVALSTWDLEHTSH